MFLQKKIVTLFFADYDPRSDSLRINYYEIQGVAKTSKMDADSLLETSMDHELAHYRVDKLREELGLTSIMDTQYSRDLLKVYVAFIDSSEREQGETRFAFQNFVNMKRDDITTIVIDLMINEGISMYYERKGTEPIVTSYPTSIHNINSNNAFHRHVYFTGWDLMHSIIQEHGEKGIRYVLLHMPTIQEFENLQGYKKRILKELAQ
jgi:hypothetical protein